MSQGLSSLSKAGRLSRSKRLERLERFQQRAETSFVDVESSTCKTKPVSYRLRKKLTRKEN
jgi:hypothetical protein